MHANLSLCNAYGLTISLCDVYRMPYRYLPHRLCCRQLERRPDGLPGGHPARGRPGGAGDPAGAARAEETKDVQAQEAARRQLPPLFHCLRARRMCKSMKGS